MGSNDRRCLFQRRESTSFQHFVPIYPAICSSRHGQFFPQFITLLCLTSTFSFKGSSLIRGPEDVIQYIIGQLGNGGRYPCTHSHSLAFSIGGQLFPVDPRDFASQALPNSVEACSPNIVGTDPPYVGGYQFSWILGIPFLKRFRSSLSLSFFVS